MEQIYSIAGMTCENCRRHVKEALEALPGVTEVEVTLESGRALVRGDRDLQEAEVRAAIQEAGYTLA